MKPAWDKLMQEFAESDTVLVADVDCTAAGKSKCSEVGVRGYPKLKYGDPSSLQDYSGKRDFEELKKFAAGLGPACTLKNIHQCDDAAKAMIEGFRKLPADEIASMIASKEAGMQKLESDFKAVVEELKKNHEDAMAKKDEAVAELSLGLLKAVHLHASKAKSEL